MAPAVRDTVIGDHWSVLAANAAPFRAIDWDHDRVWQLPAMPVPDLIPAVGPAVYVAFDRARCLYVGQTRDLRVRVRAHMRDPYREARWKGLAVFRLHRDVPQRIVDRLEAEAARRLRPVDGRAWPAA